MLSVSVGNLFFSKFLQNRYQNDFYSKMMDTHEKVYKKFLHVWVHGGGGGGGVIKYFWPMKIAYLPVVITQKLLKIGKIAEN